MSFRRYAYYLDMDANSKWSQILSIGGFCFFLYAALRSGVRIFGLELPNQCSESILANPFTITNACAPVSTFVSTRVATWNSAHVWAWLLIAFVGIFASLYPRRLDGGRGFALALFLVVFHESIWYVIYFSVNPNKLYWLLHYAPFLAFLFMSLSVWAYMKYNEDINFKAMLLFAIPWFIFLAGWATIGYPLSLDLLDGATAWYGKPIIDLVEMSSWLFVSSAVVWGYAVRQNKNERLRRAN